MAAVRTFAVDGGFVVSENGVWIPGLYDTRETAEYAATLSPDIVDRASIICRSQGENRPIVRDDLRNLARGR